MSNEDIFWEIYHEMEKLNLQKEFHTQLKKMKEQKKHKYMDTKERWEYAAIKVKKKKNDK